MLIKHSGGGGVGRTSWFLKIGLCSYLPFPDPKTLGPGGTLGLPREPGLLPGVYEQLFSTAPGSRSHKSDACTGHHAQEKHSTFLWGPDCAVQKPLPTD